MWFIKFFLKKFQMMFVAFQLQKQLATFRGGQRGQPPPKKIDIRRTDCYYLLNYDHYHSSLQSKFKVSIQVKITREYMKKV